MDDCSIGGWRACCSPINEHDRRPPGSSFVPIALHETYGGECRGGSSEFSGKFVYTLVQSGSSSDDDVAADARSNDACGSWHGPSSFEFSGEKGFSQMDRVRDRFRIHNRDSTQICYRSHVSFTQQGGFRFVAQRHGAFCFARTGEKEPCQLMSTKLYLHDYTIREALGATGSCVETGSTPAALLRLLHFVESTKRSRQAVTGVSWLVVLNATRR
eukprot:TRINITY_DN45506_c0_g1_i1.p1 TRINITY_DN45506_c0_g1~~TRINITY_DN45506_c0_g1_i1.p1  ORF type:complete len:215 (-),score=10.90 TRINITY_DN45506_c0_g1_i1:165-809(-)